MNAGGWLLGEFSLCGLSRKSLTSKESCKNLLPMKAGVALNPHTPVEVLESIISEIDLVCVMSVNPGFGGQSFIESTYNKVLKLKNLIKKKNASSLIEIDGGVNDKNSSKLIEHGADVLVSGNYIFRDQDPNEAIKRLR